MHENAPSNGAPDRSRKGVREHVSADVAPELFTAVDDESRESPAEGGTGHADRT